MDRFALVDSIIGNATRREKLKDLIRANRLPHALLFSGTAGVGKQTTARAVASAVLAESGGVTPEQSFSLLQAGNHPDLHMLTLQEGKKDLAIEQIRSLIEKLQLKPYYGRRAVGVIDSADRMNKASANALLMTLEEPAEGVLLVLIARAAHRLPETILSRCQEFSFAPLSQTEFKLLLNRLDPSITGVEADKLQRMTGGSLGPLDLEAFIDPATGRVSDAEGLSEQIKAVTSKTAELERRLDRLLSSDSDRAERIDLALGLSAILGEKGELSGFGIHLILNRFSEILRRPEARARLAPQILEMIPALEAVSERNLQPELQLNEILLRLATC